jgi:hypothetical protein
MEKYLCGHWKNFLYALTTNIAQGYWYFSQFQYPLKKENKWEKIDLKLLRKYPCAISKDKRYRRKKKGLANYRFFRWQSQAIFLRTEGILEDVKDDENWKKLEGKEKIVVQVGQLEFEIRSINKKTSIKLSRESYRSIKTNIIEKIEKKNIFLLEYAIEIYKRLWNIPNYKFLYIQKQKIKEEMIKAVQKHYPQNKKVLKQIKEIKIYGSSLKEGKLFVK